jgi:hypothetical protein
MIDVAQALSRTNCTREQFQEPFKPSKTKTARSQVMRLYQLYALHRLKNKGWYQKMVIWKLLKQKPYANGQSALLGD